MRTISMVKATDNFWSDIFSFVRVAVLACVLVLVSFGDSDAKRRGSGWMASKKAVLVVDMNTGRELYQYKAGHRRYPASLTKMMTLYVVFEDLAANRLTMNTRIRISRRASHQPPSKLGLKAGSRLRIGDAVLSLITKSANDVAYAVAEHVSKSEPAFVKRMNRTARRLGMSRTTFRNSSGLPHRSQRTTARDLVKLAQALQVNFPQYYKLFSRKSYRFGKRTYPNHNKLLKTMSGVDGIKTGYIRASGFNLVSSRRLGGRHIVAVVLGGPTSRARNSMVAHLLKKYIKRGSRTRVAWGVNKRVSGSGRVLKLATLPNRRPSASSRTAMVKVASIPMPTRRSGVSASQIPASARIDDENTNSSSPGAAFLLAESKPVGEVNPADKRANELLLGYRNFDTSDANANKQSGSASAPASSDQTNSGNPAISTLTSVPSSKPGSNPSRAQQQSAEKRLARLPTNPARSEYMIQVGTSSDEVLAMDLLRKAWTLAGVSGLKRSQPFIEKVSSGPRTFYRARFGSLTKPLAAAACEVLKSEKMGCFVIIDRSETNDPDVQVHST